MTPVIHYPKPDGVHVKWDDKETVIPWDQWDRIIYNVQGERLNYTQLSERG